MVGAGEDIKAQGVKERAHRPASVVSKLVNAVPKEDSVRTLRPALSLHRHGGCQVRAGVFGASGIGVAEDLSSTLTRVDGSASNTCVCLVPDRRH